eukprot:12930528-Prorocentrum_lima.AAC.1
MALAPVEQDIRKIAMGYWITPDWEFFGLHGAFKGPRMIWRRHQHQKSKSLKHRTSLKHHLKT